MGCSSSTLGTTFIATPPNQTEDFFFDTYYLGPKLGQGSYGQVRAAICLENGASELKAVKVLTGENDEQVCRAYREIDAWESIPQHSNVVALHDVFFTSGMCFLVMERCSCSFIHHLETLEKLNERTLGKLLHQILEGILHLHNAHIVHRDIKAENFLIAQDGHTVKLCDFSLSVRLPMEGFLVGRAGTAPFMCPEMLTRCGYNEKADIWSLGVLTYTLLFGTFPYAPENVRETATKDAMFTAILAGKPPKFQADGHSLFVVRFVNSLLSREYETRLSAKEALESAYIVSCKEDRHAEGADLSSLKPMLREARKHGALYVSRAKEFQVDFLLERMHHAKYGSPIPRSLVDVATNKASTGQASSKKHMTFENIGNSKHSDASGPKALPIEEHVASSVESNLIFL